ncbi:MAG: RNA-binding S4 domain-containing protein [Bacteroidales bacterium]
MMKKKEPISFKIEGEYIELIQLLKVLNLAESGGHAKQLVDEGLVKVNGATESRKRAKLRAGDKVTFMHQDVVME